MTNRARRAKTTSAPLPVGIVDVETDWLRGGEEPRTRFWGAWTPSTGYLAASTFAALAALLPAEPHRIYHHHDYDVLQALSEGERLRSLTRVVGGRVVESRFEACPQHVFRNSLKIFPASMKHLLRGVGLDKPDIGPDSPLELLRERNRADCEGAMVAFRAYSAAMRAAIGIDPLEARQSTIAGLAFAWAESAAGKLPPDARARSAYRGGRVELYQAGRIPLAHSYDIASSYPASIARSADFPRVRWLFRVRTLVRPDCWIPPLVSARHLDAMLFPVGPVDAWAWDHELDAYRGTLTACQITERVRVDTGWLQRLAPAMRAVYDQRRATKDPAERYVLKLVMNSAYGRIGLRPEREVFALEETLPAPSRARTDYSATTLRSGQILTWRTFPIPEEEHSASFPLAALITADARLRWWEAARRHETTLIYGDTDSLKLSERSEDLDGRGGGALGSWTYEGAARDFEAHGPKAYSWSEAAAEDEEDQRRTKRKGGSGGVLRTLKLAAAGKPPALVDRHASDCYIRRRLDGDRYRPVTVAEYEAELKVKR